MFGRSAGFSGGAGRVAGEIRGLFVQIRRQAALAGGPQTRANRLSQPLCHGQLVGRCRVRLRAEEAILAGMLIRVRRMVPVVALVRVPPAMVAAARVRLKAMHANTSHALFAENRPVGGPARSVSSLRARFR